MQVLKYGNVFLSKRAKEVIEFDSLLQEQSDMMYETMLQESGIGLAGTQVGLDRRLVVIDLGDDKGRIDLVNPVILSKSKHKDLGQEGCLSIPGVFAKVERYTSISVEAYNLKGEKFSFNPSGLLARAIQHEIDHLDGVLFVDHLDNLEKKKVKWKLKKVKDKYKKVSSDIAF